MVFLASDNTSGISPAVLAALERVNGGHAPSYGADAETAALTDRLRDVFAHPDLCVFPVLTGSAANGAALAALMRPYEAVIARTSSHIQQDECGLPEFFTGGKILTVPGPHGKIDPAAVAEVLARAANSGVHHSRPRVLSLTQSTEQGTVYHPDEIRALSALARASGLTVHMDGARFANAVARLGCSPAALSWQAGVDVLVFGGTKNGALLAEAVIFFRPELAADFGYLRKRFGQLAAKQRYVAAQLLALLEDDLWLTQAAHSNRMARLLAAGLDALPGVAVLLPVEANAVFVRLPATVAAQLRQRGHVFYAWPLLGQDVCRLIAGFTTTADEIAAFVADAQAVCAAAAGQVSGPTPLPRQDI